MYLTKTCDRITFGPGLSRAGHLTRILRQEKAGKLGRGLEQEMTGRMRLLVKYLRDCALGDPPRDQHGPQTGPCRKHTLMNV